MGQAAPPGLADIRRSIDAHGVEAALDGIVRKFPNVRRAEPNGDGRDFRVVTGRIQAPGMMLVNMRTTGVALTWDPIDRLALFLPVRGRIVCRYGTRADEGHAGSQLVIARADQARGELSPGYDGYFIIVDKVALRREAEAWIGEHIASLFTPEAVHSGVAHGTVAQALASINARASAEIAPGSRNAPAGAQNELFRALMAGPFRPMLEGYNSLRAPEVGALTVRRAIDYIRAHSASDVSMADLAAATGVGVRALQQAFRRHLCATPWQYLIMCRLEQARAQLSTARPGDTVTRIALDAGAAHLGEFSLAYFRRFREHPSATLARSQAEYVARPRARSQFR